jgi:hypothetical protein
VRRLVLWDVRLRTSLLLAAIPALVVCALVSLDLPLLLGGSTSTVTVAVLTALAIVALVRARPVLRTTRFVTLVALVGGTRSLLATVGWEQGKGFAEGLAEAMAWDSPDRFVATMAKRRGAGIS